MRNTTQNSHASTRIKTGGTLPINASTQLRGVAISRAIALSRRYIHKTYLVCSNGWGFYVVTSLRPGCWTIAVVNNGVVTIGQ